MAARVPINCEAAGLSPQSAPIFSSLAPTFPVAGPPAAGPPAPAPGAPRPKLAFLSLTRELHASSSAQADPLRGSPVGPESAFSFSSSRVSISWERVRPCPRPAPSPPGASPGSGGRGWLSWISHFSPSAGGGFFASGARPAVPPVGGPRPARLCPTSRGDGSATNPCVGAALATVKGVLPPGHPTRPRCPPPPPDAPPGNVERRPGLRMGTHGHSPFFTGAEVVLDAAGGEGGLEGRGPERFGAPQASLRRAFRAPRGGPPAAASSGHPSPAGVPPAARGVGRRGRAGRRELAPALQAAPWHFPCAPR